MLLASILWILSPDGNATDNVFYINNVTDLVEKIGASDATQSDLTYIRHQDEVPNGIILPVTIISGVKDTSEIMVIINENPYPLSARYSFPNNNSEFIEVQGRFKIAKKSDITILVKSEGKYYINTSHVNRVEISGIGESKIYKPCQNSFDLKNTNIKSAFNIANQSNEDKNFINALGYNKATSWTFKILLQHPMKNGPTKSDEESC